MRPRCEGLVVMIDIQKFPSLVSQPIRTGDLPKSQPATGTP